MFQRRYYMYVSVFTALFHNVQNQLENLGLNKTATQSSTHLNANKAVNGYINQKYGYCASTSWPSNVLKPLNAWWQVDLGMIYGINSIKIYHRNYTRHRLNGFQIIESADGKLGNKQPCYKDDLIGDQPSIVTIEACKGPARYVRISNDKYNKTTDAAFGPILELCEVQIYGCPQNKYGNDCRSDCHCEQKGCFYENGTCFVKGCESGWQGTSCNKTCAENKFGPNCAFTCHCRDGSCNRTNGICDIPSCEAGWKGDNCSTSCNMDQNEFGFDCNSTCNCHIGTCNSTTGNCNTPGCKAGWKNSSCSSTCDSNHNEFGMNCNSTCHCLTGPCNRTTGDCDMPGCKDGWQGTTCSSPCMNNTFGFECNSTCHCKDGSCNNTDGHCFKPGCKPGWKGNNCSIQCAVNTFGPDCNTCNCLNGTCDNIAGICDITGCKPGYQGKNCSIVCDKDSFGSNCSSKCFCKAGTCNTETGKCNGDMCRDGYIGETCTEKCENGTFGYQCASECHCLIGFCHNVYGTCNFQGCREGWKGSTCSEKVQAPEPNTGVIAGVVSAGVVVVVIVIGLLLYKKRRVVKKDKQNNRNHIDSERDFNAGFSELGVIEDKGPKNQKNAEVNEIEYANLEPRTNTNISIKELKTRLLKSTVEEELEKEYEDIKNEPGIPTTAGEKTENKDKNRFLSIFPYDHSRVVLETLPGVPNSDYINANYIDGVNNCNKSIYVAAQGPKTTTVIDFWRMIWQIKSGIIVMLANPMEKGKNKCFKYWPDVTKVQIHGDLKITLDSEFESLYFTNRQLNVTHQKTGEIRNIHHLHFTTWPDHGTPDPTQLVLFHRNYMKTKSDLLGPPVVHCSAGVGRTGTFIALDALYKYGKTNDTVDVFEYVKVMRKNRMSMVQTKEQYIFLHEALLKSFEFKETSLSKDEFITIGNQDKRIKAEFKNLVQNIPKYDSKSYKGGMEKHNLLKNRSQNILPVDKFRPYLMSYESTRSNYINAVIVPSYKDHTGFLVTQCPLLDTVVDFWCLVYDHESSTIVTLDCTSEDGPVLNWIPTNKSSTQIGRFSLRRTKDTTDIGDTKETEVCLVNEENERIIKVFEVQSWRQGLPTPSSGHVLLKLIEMVEHWKTTASDGPITVVCMDGAKCCGLFCALFNSIQKLRYEDDVDIYQTVKQLQVRRPEFFSSIEQYRFFYNVVQEYIENANIYMN